MRAVYGSLAGFGALLGEAEYVTKPHRMARILLYKNPSNTRSEKLVSSIDNGFDSLSQIFSIPSQKMVNIMLLAVVARKEFAYHTVGLAGHSTVSSAGVY